MHTGSWEPPEHVGCNYAELTSLHIRVSHKQLKIYSSEPTTELHKILHPTLKGEPQAGLLPSCSSNSTNSMEQDFGNLGSTLGQMKMSQAD